MREPDEFEQGAIPGAVFIPRGHLEAQVEGRIPDRDTSVVIFCAGGVRSAFAAKTLGELGYTDVVSMTGGFNQWKDQGRPWETPRTLSPEQRNRYQRHLLLPEVGEEGQLQLLDAKVLLLGAGGLGSPAALYLAAAGVGTIGIVDMDVVDESNLQRQIVHNLDRVGMRKVDSARETIEKLNPDVTVITHDTRLDAANVVELLSQYDLVVDGADNFPSRYLLNDASLKTGTPVVHGSIFRFEGQVTVFTPHDGPCYRCFLPVPPPPELAPSCAEAGVLGVLPGIIGSIQALEAIKLHPRPRRLALGSTAGLRQPRAVVHDLQGPSRPRLPGMLDRPVRRGHRRVRPVLHPTPRAGPRRLRAPPHAGPAIGVGCHPDRRLGCYRQPGRSPSGADAPLSPSRTTPCRLPPVSLPGAALGCPGSWPR